MSISYFDDFSSYSVVQPLPKKVWWRRLLRIRRPAGQAYVHFKFKFSAGNWQHAEVMAEYPSGMDSIKLTFQACIDGEELYFAPDMSIATT